MFSKRTIVTITLITLSGTTALAQDWMGPREQHPKQHMGEQDSSHRGPDIEAIASELGLDPATTAKLKAIKRQARNDLMDARFAVKKAKTAMRDLLEEDTPNESQIMRQIEEIGRLEVNVHKLKVRSLLAARALLTPEQRAAFKKLRRAQKEHRRDKRKHRKMKRQF